jgi:purine-binding chemotaxis protein CheW
VTASGREVLLVRAGRWLCALPVPCVLETMREQAVRPLAGTPTFVRGLSLIRGVSTAVICLSTLLEGRASSERARLVLLRVGEGRVAVAVDAVHGLADLAELEMQALPALASEIRQQHVESIHRMDGELVVLLQTARLLPAELEQAVQVASGATQ